MPRTLLKGRTRLDLFAAADLPANLAAIKVSEFADAVPLSCIVLAENYKFGAAASDKVTQPALCEKSNTSAFDASNWEASMWFFRYRNATTGVIDPADDLAWAELKTKGTEVVLVERTGLDAAVGWAAAQDYLALPVMADEPLASEDRSGYERFGQVFATTGDGIRGIVAAS